MDELQNLAKDAFGVAAHLIIEQFIHAKMPPRLRKSINQAYLENGSCEQIVTHLEKELDLNSLEAPDELQMNNMTQKQQTEGNNDNAGNINTDANNPNSNNNKNDKQSSTVGLPYGTCGNTNHPTEKFFYGANAANMPLPWKNKPAVHNGPQPQDEQNNRTKSVMAVKVSTESATSSLRDCM